MEPEQVLHNAFPVTKEKPNHVSTPKPWKEYLFEGFMIFLAVVLGFFAESYREYLSDQTKEKEYILSLMADLEENQVALDAYAHHVTTGVSLMDSVILLLNEPQEISHHTGAFYYLARLGPRLSKLSLNTRTFDQLNSGNFGLIKDVSVANKIMSYYEKLPLIRQIEAIHESEFVEYKRVAAKVLDPVVLTQTQQANDDIARIPQNPPLSISSPDLLKELSVYSIYMNGSRRGLLKAEGELKASGKELIGFLKKVYKVH